MTVEEHLLSSYCSLFLRLTIIFVSMFSTIQLELTDDDDLTFVDVSSSLVDL